MSLFLGNLSSHTRLGDLERVFGRFGRCEVQLKDGFGFAVYDRPDNAERALRFLRGRSVCGNTIIVDWSKQQPLQRPHREDTRRPAIRHDEQGERAPPKCFLCGLVGHKMRFCPRAGGPRFGPGRKESNSEGQKKRRKHSSDEESSSSAPSSPRRRRRRNSRACRQDTETRLTMMSYKEMCTALGHYCDLPAPAAAASVGNYFGAARLWPWEMVFYRRTKKHPCPSSTVCSPS